MIKLAPEQATKWSDREVALRWTQIYKGPLILHMWLEGKVLTPAYEQTAKDIIHQHRQRLQDLDWVIKRIHAFSPSGREAFKNCSCIFV